VDLLILLLAIALVIVTAGLIRLCAALEEPKS
jgi:hypothetical protein